MSKLNPIKILTFLFIARYRRPSGMMVGILFISLIFALGCESATNEQVELGENPFGAELQNMPIQEIVAQTFVLQDFEAMLVASKVAGELDSPPYTFFAPWDDAFKRLPYWTEITQNRAWYGHLRDLALGHIHSGNLSKDKIEGDMMVTMLNGDVANIGKQNTSVTVDGNRTIGSTPGTDGYLYLLDNVREPKWTKQTILNIIDNDERFSILAQILKHPSLSAKRDELNSTPASGGFTVFAPTNQALAGLNIEECVEDECFSTFKLLVENHIIGAVVPKRFTPTQKLTTESGTPLDWDFDTQSISCTNADQTLEYAGLDEAGEELAINGIVHPIDALMCTHCRTMGDGCGTTVEVLKNVAKHKDAVQSTTRSDYYGAERAVDGSLGGITLSSYSATLVSDQPWWRVELGGANHVRRVTIYPYHNSKTPLLSDFRVDYFGPDGQLLASKTHEGQATTATQIDMDVTGVHSVMIQRLGTDTALALKEVQVWGVHEAPPGPTQLPEQLNVTVSRQDGDYEIALNRVWLRRPNFRLYTVDGKDSYQRVLPVPEPRTYRGKVLNNPFLLVTGTVDEGGVLYLSTWNGRHREWIADVPLRSGLNANGYTLEKKGVQLAGSPSDPPAQENRWTIPEPGSGFHVRLARVNAMYYNDAFAKQAGGSLVNALAQIETAINESDIIFGQKIGLRWSLQTAIIEPTARYVLRSLGAPNPGNLSPNFQMGFGDVGFCQAGIGARNLLCIPGYRVSQLFPHEIGHALGMDMPHTQGLVDSQNHIYSVSGHLKDTEVGDMQSQIFLAQLPHFDKAEEFSSPMLPAAYMDYMTVYQNQTGYVEPLKNDYDANGDFLQIDGFDTVTQQGGSVTQVGNELHYIPHADFVGHDSFTYTASDGVLKTEQTIHVLVLPTGIAGSWDVENGAEPVVDKGGLGRNLEVLAEDPQLAIVPGIRGNGLAAPAIASYDWFDDPLSNTISPHVFDPGHKSFTASVWFKYSNIDADRIIVGKGRDGSRTSTGISQGGWEIRAKWTSLVMNIAFRDRLAIETQVEIQADDVIEDGKWHHVVMVIDRQEQVLRGYLDGVFLKESEPFYADAGGIIAAETKAYYSDGGSPLRVGNHTQEPSGTSAWDSLKIYHKALTQSEVQALFDSP